MNSLIYSKKSGKFIGACVVLNHMQMRAEDYQRLHDEFCDLIRKPRADYIGSVVDLDPCFCDDGVYWEESFACAGCHFVIFQLPGVSAGAVDAVKREMKSNRDAESIQVVKITQLLDFKFTPSCASAS